MKASLLWLLAQAGLPLDEQVRRMEDPWAGERVGAWYRMRTETAGTEIYTDVGLAERAADSYVLASQTSVQGRAGAERKTRVEPYPVVFSAERVLPDRGHDFINFAAVERSRERTARRWLVYQEGPLGGVRLGEADPSAARSYDVETLRVKDRDYVCLVVETPDATSWNAAAFPPGAVRSRGKDSATALIDFGDDWSRRPPFPGAEAPASQAPTAEPAPTPAPKADPKPSERVRKNLEEAARLIRDAAPVLEELARDTDALPDDEDILGSLIEKAEGIERSLLKAQFHYRVIRYEVEDTGNLDRRVRLLEEVVGVIRASRRELRESLK